MKDVLTKKLSTPLLQKDFWEILPEGFFFDRKFITLAKVDFPLGQAADISDKRRLTNANRQKKKLQNLSTTATTSF